MCDIKQARNLDLIRELKQRLEQSYYPKNHHNSIKHALKDLEYFMKLNEVNNNENNN